jgi:hypothetical protein
VDPPVPPSGTGRLAGDYRADDAPAGSGTAAVAAAAVGTFTVVGAIGYVAAPYGQLGVVRDPVGRAQAAFSSSLGQFPLVSDSLSAVMLADAGQLAAYPPTLGPTPSPAHQPLTEQQADAAMTRAVGSQHSVSYSGRQSFYATREGQSMWAAIAVQARSGQGLEVKVLSRSGEQLVYGFSPRPSRPGWSTTTCSTCWPATTPDRGRRRHRGRAQRDRDLRLELGQRAARWWLDDETGIVLWQELYDGTGAVALSVGFHLGDGDAGRGDDGPPAAAAAARNGDDLVVGGRCHLARGLRLDLWSGPVGALAGPAAHRQRGGPVGGAGDIQRRRRHGCGARAARPAGRRARRHAVGPRPRAYVRHGASQTATWQANGHVLTVVTDGPADVLTRAVASLPPERSAPPTTMDRVREGWASILAELKG